jgi:DNA-binding beta-propeller fold protein YncE
VSRRLLVAAAVVLGLPAVAFGLPGGGAPAQVPGKAGCHAGATSAGCRPAVGVVGAEAIAVSRDGRNVYAAGGIGRLGRLAVFARNPATGRLTQLGRRDGCFQVYRASTRCAPGRALETPTSVVVSPDGANVYVTAQSNSAIAVLRARAGRPSAPADGPGRLREPDRRALPARARVRPAERPRAEPDGANVYAGSNSRVAVFRRLQPDGPCSSSSAGPAV